MTNRFNFPKEGKFILIRGETSYVLVGQAGTSFALCIEAPDGEVCQGLSEDDIIAVSSPEGGALEPAVMLLELVRRFRTPLVVLPADHPGSERLRYVVSAGCSIRLSCTVRRGTHPEQDILCSGGEFSGMLLRAVPGGIEISGGPENYEVSYLSYDLHLDQESSMSPQFDTPEDH